MKTKHTLSFEPRTVTGRKVKTLRVQGLVPASIFGKKTKTLNIQVNTKEFLKVYKEVGESTLVYLGEHPALISEVTFHPVTSQVLHVSFHEVDLNEKVTAPVSLVIEGEAPAEQDKLGIMVQQLDEVEIEALPTEMPENVKVDVSTLTEVGSQILVSDLKLGSKLTLKSAPDSIIVKIEALAKEEIKEVVPAVAAEGEAAPVVPEEGTSVPEKSSEPKSE